MQFDIIASGSKGNAVVINNSILIDIGVPFKALEPYKKGLKLVLTSHQHGDHFNPRTVRVLHRERPGIRWGCCEWMVGPLLEAGVDKRVIDVFDPTIPAFLMYGPHFSIRPQLLSHDVPNCGYHMIFYQKDQKTERLFYATDTGTLDGIDAPGYDLYMIEANYVEEELKARQTAKLAAGQYSYESRAAATHLSREQAEEWLYRNMGPNSKYVFLHQHKEEP